MTSIKDIVEEIVLESKHSDSIFKNISVPFAYKYAKEGLKKMNLSNMLYVDVMNVEIPFACKVFKAPDFLHTIKVDILHCSGKTVEVRRNNSVPNEVKQFLVQCNGQLITGNDGFSLTSETLSCSEDTFKCTCGHPEESCKCNKIQYYQDCETRELLYQLKKYENSWFADKKDYVQFSADLEAESVNIWYMKNEIMSVEECQLYVPENLTEALEYYIKYKLLEGGVDTIQTAQYYKREYKKLRSIAIQQNNPVLTRDLKNIQFYK